MLNSKNSYEKLQAAKIKTIEVIECKINPNINGLIIDSVKITSNKKSIRTGGTGRKPKKAKQPSLRDLILGIDGRLTNIESDIKGLKNRVTDIESNLNRVVELNNLKH